LLIASNRFVIEDVGSAGDQLVGMTSVIGHILSPDHSDPADGGNLADN
jgi:hypothetical protein